MTDRPMARALCETGYAPLPEYIERYASASDAPETGQAGFGDVPQDVKPTWDDLVAALREVAASKMPGASRAIAHRILKLI